MTSVAVEAIYRRWRRHIGDKNTVRVRAFVASEIRCRGLAAKNRGRARRRIVRRLHLERLAVLSARALQDPIRAFLPSGENTREYF